MNYVERVGESDPKQSTGLQQREPTVAKLAAYGGGLGALGLLLAVLLFPVTVMLAPAIILGMVAAGGWYGLRRHRLKQTGGPQHPPIGETP